MVKKVINYTKSLFLTDLFRVFSLTSLSTLVRMLSGLITAKVMAIIIGPTGIALLGQLNSFSSIILSLSNGGISNGIVKYVSEYKNSKYKTQILLSNCLKITLFFSVLCGILMIVLNIKLSKWIFLTDEYYYIFIIFGFTIVLYALNIMLISLVNGFKEFKEFVKINIANTILGVIFTVSFIYFLGFKGALISAVTYQSVMIFITFFMIKKMSWFNIESFKHKINYNIIKKLSSYSLMTLVSVLIVPVSQLILRSYIITNISTIEAGWWEAMNRISGMYLLVITSSLGVYYLPKLSETMSQKELQKEIFFAYKFITPILILGITAVYFFRFWIVKILFSEEFLPMTNLFIWQLIGDTFKIFSWILAYVMLAKAKVVLFICTELFFPSFFLLLSFHLINKGFGIIGVTQAYALKYILYFLSMIFLFRKIIFFRNDVLS